MKTELRIYDIEINEDDESTGISLLSMVYDPAIKSEFVKLAEEPKAVHLAANNAKQYVSGAVLIPDKLIYRKDQKTGEEYYIKFSSANIEKIRNRFFKTGNLKLSNLEHSAETEIEAYLIESWICEDVEQDKAKALGLADVIQGALYATYHIPDIRTWEYVSNSTNGFSLEGTFNHVQHKLSDLIDVQREFDWGQPDLEDEIISLLEEILKAD